MKGKKLVCLLLASVLLIAIVAGCNSGTGGTSGTTGGTTSGTTGSSGTSSGGTDSGTTAATGGADREYYEFSVYANYDWWDLKTWGNDEASKWWSEKFNIKPIYSKPDSNADEKLNLMLSSGDLPDAIIMDRGAQNIKMARMGLLVDLDSLKPLVDNKWYDEAFSQATQNILKIDGVLYSIPNWARNKSTGGNEMWMYTTEIYEAAGSPEIKTFDDLYNYAVNVRDNVKKTTAGIDTIPFGIKDFNEGNGTQLIRAFYRLMGSPTTSESTYYGRVGDMYQLIFRDPVYRQATMEANKWFREGLLHQSAFTNNGTQWLEQLTNARVGLMWYDMSQDDVNNFRKIVRETYPGNSIEYITFDYNGTTYFNPPANGLSPDQLHTDHDSTVGWNVNCITTKAAKPERIFELYSHFVTKEGAIIQMYGPEGDMWDGFDADGNVNFNIVPSDLTAADSDRLGIGFWSQPAHSNWWDDVKYAANDALPVDQQSWVITAQYKIMTPLKGALSDEYTQIDWAIEPNTDLAVKRTLCQDYFNANLPKILMASTAEDAERLYDELIAWAEANGMAEIEAAYNAKYQENCTLQGGSVYADGHRHP